MTGLAEDLAALIASEGPIPVDRFMALALGHPRHGYYMTRDPFGAAGDFVTAPEISQIFGELMGVWAASTWNAMGRPASVRLIEIGPGRGTLMADLLRAAKALPAFAAALDLHLVETSPVLAERQRQALRDAGTWHRSLDTVPAGPTILIANEFLDALPIRQFVRSEAGWRERLIGMRDGALAFGLSHDPVPPSVIPEALRNATPGTLVEICPAFEAVTAALAARGAPLAALFIDYGHAESRGGETLQAVKAHRPVEPLAEPGDADLTAHVDFAAFAAAARGAGLATSRVIAQRDLLFGLGLAERAERLVAAKPEAFGTIRAGVERLIDPAPTGMGALFKAITLASDAALLARLPLAD